MQKLWAKFRNWNPSTATATVLITLSSFVIISSLIVAFLAIQSMESRDASGSETDEASVSDSSEPILISPLVGIVSHIHPSGARLYVEREPGEPVENASYVCLDDKDALVSTGSVDSPFTALNDLESGRTISCSVQAELGSERLEVPSFTVPYPLAEVRDLVSIGANMVNAPEPTVRISWAVDTFENTEKVWVEYALYSENRFVAGGKKDFSEGAITHPLSDKWATSETPLSLFVWLVGDSSGNRVPGDAYLFESKEEGWSSTPVLLTDFDFKERELKTNYSSIISKNSAVLDSRNDLSVVFSSNDSEWLVLSETGSLTGAWQSMELEDESKEIETVVAKRLPFYMPASVTDSRLTFGNPKIIASDTTAWMPVSPALKFLKESTYELSWKMWSPANAALVWREAKTGNFIVSATDIFSGKTITTVSGGEPKVSLSGLTPTKLYVIKVSYVDMNPGGESVATGEFMLQVPATDAVITQVPFYAQYRSNGTVEVLWSEETFNGNVDYWVQVLDPERNLIVQEKVSAASDPYREFDFGDSNYERLFIRVISSADNGTSNSGLFTELVKSTGSGESSGSVENFRAERVGGREIDLTWNEHPLINVGGYYELQTYSLDSGWTVLAGDLAFNEYSLILDEGQDSFTMRVRARTESAVEPFVLLRCSINNGLFCD